MVGANKDELECMALEPGTESSNVRIEFGINSVVGEDWQCAIPDSGAVAIDSSSILKTGCSVLTKNWLMAVKEGRIAVTIYKIALL